VSAPRLLVTGSRDWVDEVVIRDALRGWWESTGRNPEAVLVSGCCPTGADALAEAMWSHNGLRIERHPADWTTHGRAAGPRRNQAMVSSGPDACVAFIRNNSRGATGTVAMCRRAGVPVTVYAS
jgi:hypothetical protein